MYSNSILLLINEIPLKKLFSKLHMLSTYIPSPKNDFSRSELKSSWILGGFPELIIIIVVIDYYY